jgi:hypothetical protein
MKIMLLYFNQGMFSESRKYIIGKGLNSAFCLYEKMPEMGLSSVFTRTTCSTHGNVNITHYSAEVLKL